MSNKQIIENKTFEVTKEIIDNRIESLFEDVEMPLSIILTEMENEGVNIDNK